ncbi:uncharacterized protein LOC131623628 [Vicia villosa]|uniref:uncharacterized protein LOC131623628 n=1 Tax=Vicia villosa TaxID=3911 RepID=UPI00273AE2CE|nr:uncharacterized protein LOC131623628 [Vicia villosa]
MYQELRGELDQMDWRKLFFSNYARPRVVFILWLTVSGRLQTKDRFIRYGISVDAKCVFCSAEEAMDHLMLECSKTNGIWRNILTWIGYNRGPANWTIERTWLITETTKKGWRRDILKTAIAETVYVVWRMRNDVVFNQHTMDDTITNRIKESIVTIWIGYRKLATHINR